VPRPCRDWSFDSLDKQLYLQLYWRTFQKGGSTLVEHARTIFRGGNEGKKRFFFDGRGEEQWPAKDATFIAATLYVSIDRPTLFTAPYCTTKYMVLGLLANCTCLRKNLIVFFFRLYFLYGQVT
jgi:hypothetical protein